MKNDQNSQFWACFGVFERLDLFCLNFAIAEKLYFLHFFANYDGWEAEKLRNKLFCIKNVDFLTNYKGFSFKM